MEGAVRSGYLAAEGILEDLGRPESLVRPGLATARLARWLLGPSQDDEIRIAHHGIAVTRAQRIMNDGTTIVDEHVLGSETPSFDGRRVVTFESRLAGRWPT